MILLGPTIDKVFTEQASRGRDGLPQETAALQSQKELALKVSCFPGQPCHRYISNTATFIPRSPCWAMGWGLFQLPPEFSFWGDPGETIKTLCSHYASLSTFQPSPHLFLTPEYTEACQSFLSRGSLKHEMKATSALIHLALNRSVHCYLGKTHEEGVGTSSGFRLLLISSWEVIKD